MHNAKIYSKLLISVALSALISTSASAKSHGGSSAVNGACGSSNGLSLVSEPTSNLCSKGTASSVAGNGPWTWTCAGSNGGSTASCSAAVESENGVCGSSNGQTLATAPTTNLCTTGNASAVTGTGPWNWSCSGIDGGTVANCSAQAPSTTGSIVPSVLPVSGLVLTFDDEFNTLSVGEPGSSGSNLWEANYYYNTPQPCGIDLAGLSVSNGSLTMTASSTTAAQTSCGYSYPYTAAHMDTFNSFSQQYGYFEARAKANGNFGTVWAFWMIPENGAWPPEIDAPEILGRVPTIDYVTNHYSSKNLQKQFSPTESNLSQAYHVYGVLWNATSITWYLDGNVVGTTPTQTGEKTPFYVLLDLYTGDCGDGWGDCPQDAPGYNASIPFSANASVDYVRVWQYSNLNPAKCVGQCIATGTVR